MAKRIILVENEVLQKLCGSSGYSDRYENNGTIYGVIGGAFDQKIELVPSPRPVDRDHLRRDFQSELDDLETVLRHLKYMKLEI